MKPSFCGVDAIARDAHPPHVSDEEVDDSEYSGPELIDSASSSGESEFGQRGFIDSSSSEEERANPPKVDARMDPSVQKALRSRKQRRKRSSILKRRVRFNLDPHEEDPIHHCAEAEDCNVRDADMDHDVGEEEQLELAKRAYEVHNHLTPGSATHDEVARSQRGVAGWFGLAKLFSSQCLMPKTADDCIVQAGVMRGLVCRTAAEARLLERLSELNAGFVGPDVAPTNGYSIDEVINHIGKPASSTLCLCEGERTEPTVMMNEEEWVDCEFEVALDSGSTDHVASTVDIPGYVVEASPGSKAGQGFIVGNGQRVPNDGQSCLNLQSTGKSSNTVATTFQVAKVSRPLMSAGRLCDAGMDVHFKKERAEVLAADGSVIMSFERQNGGLYIAKLRLKRPSPPFGRHG